MEQPPACDLHPHEKGDDPEADEEFSVGSVVDMGQARAGRVGMAVIPVMIGPMRMRAAVPMMMGFVPVIVMMCVAVAHASAIHPMP
jgi:hypothetical protein